MWIWYFKILIFASKLFLGEYWIYLMGQFGSVHTFSYNSAESEQI